MKYFVFYVTLAKLLFLSALGRCQDPNEKRLLITEQSQNRIVIVNTKSATVDWQWEADSPFIHPGHIKWFVAPSDAKIVNNSNWILMCASGGGVALIRVSDKKVLFYAFAGGNTHSIELLPDGNIVTASSDGNNLTVFAVDTPRLPGLKSSSIYVPFGHNIVWDKKRNILWSAGLNKMLKYRYNFIKDNPALELIDSISYIHEHDEAHDLFPDYDKDALWLTDTKNVYIFDPEKSVAQVVPGIRIRNVKSISSGPRGYPTIISYPKERWWTDEIMSIDGKSIFRQNGWKIYKARWILPNHFSY